MARASTSCRTPWPARPSVAASSCFAAGGRFVEMGKRDHLTAEARGARHDVTYHVIVGRRRPSSPRRSGALLRELVGAVAAVGSSAAARAGFAFDDAAAASATSPRRATSARSSSSSPMRCATARSPAIRSDATYLVTGGLSGLGPAHGQAPGARGRATWPCWAGTEPVQTAQADLAGARRPGRAGRRPEGRRRRACRCGAIARPGGRDDAAVAGRVPLPPACSTTATLGQQTWPRFGTVLAPKVDGAAHLHELTAGDGARSLRAVLVGRIAPRLPRPGQPRRGQRLPRRPCAAPGAQGRAGHSASTGAPGARSARPPTRGVDKRVAPQGIDPSARSKARGPRPR